MDMAEGKDPSVDREFTQNVAGEKISAVLLKART